MNSPREANAEPSQWMKQAAGRCDGQDGPRKGMRSTSALRLFGDEDMTCACEESQETGNRKPVPTMRISPIDTPLFTMLRKAKVNNVQTEWLVDKLDQAGSNAVPEGSSAVFTATSGAGVPAARVRLLNYTQISRENYDISDTQRAVEIRRRKTRLFAGNTQYAVVRKAA